MQDLTKFQGYTALFRADVHGPRVEAVRKELEAAGLRVEVWDVDVIRAMLGGLGQCSREELWPSDSVYLVPPTSKMGLLPDWSTISSLETTHKYAVGSQGGSR